MLFAFVAAPVHAQSITNNLQQAGKAFSGSDKSNLAQVTSPAAIVGTIIQVVLGFLGIVATALVVYAGFLYMTARGNDTQVKKALAILRNAVVGLVIIMSAYAITAFVIDQLTKQFAPSSTAPTSITPSTGSPVDIEGTTK